MLERSFWLQHGGWGQPKADSSELSRGKVTSWGLGQAAEWRGGVKLTQHSGQRIHQELLDEDGEGGGGV